MNIFNLEKDRFLIYKDGTSKEVVLSELKEDVEKSITIILPEDEALLKWAKQNHPLAIFKNKEDYELNEKKKLILSLEAK